MDWNEAFGVYPLNQNFDRFVNDYEFKKFFKSLEEGEMEDYTYLVPSAWWENLPGPGKVDPKTAPNSQ